MADKFGIITRWPVFCLSLLVGMALLVSLPFPVQAAPCQKLQGQQICLIAIKRSAKYFWQYRVTLAIDGVKQAPALYNCHDRTWQVAGGHPVSFQPQDIGIWTCQHL